MPQFCILFYANYTTLATQKGGPWPNGPPLKTPLALLYCKRPKIAVSMNNDAKWESFNGRGHALSRWESFIATTKFKQRK